MPIKKSWQKAARQVGNSKNNPFETQLIKRLKAEVFEARRERN
jgi:hypothetical protein